MNATPCMAKAPQQSSSDIPRRPGPVGQESLMPLIPAGHQRGAGKRQLGVEEKPKARQSHPPRAQPGQSQRAIAEKVAGFANGVVNGIPVRVADWSEERLQTDTRSGCEVSVGAEVLPWTQPR